MSPLAIAASCVGYLLIAFACVVVAMAYSHTKGQKEHLAPWGGLVQRRHQHTNKIELGHLFGDHGAGIWIVWPVCAAFCIVVGLVLGICWFPTKGLVRVSKFTARNTQRITESGVKLLVRGRESKVLVSD